VRVAPFNDDFVRIPALLSRANSAMSEQPPPMQSPFIIKGDPITPEGRNSIEALTCAELIRHRSQKALLPYLNTTAVEGHHMSKPKDEQLGRGSDADALRLAVAFYCIMESERCAEMLALAKTFAEQSKRVARITHFLDLPDATRKQ
jgi:hypothetical protein